MTSSIIEGLKKPDIFYGSPKAGNFKKADVDKFAEDVALKLGYNSSDEVSAYCLYDIVKEKLGGQLHFVEKERLENEIYGTAVIHGELDFDIVIPRQKGLFDANFTIAHELGHYFLHSIQGKLPLIAKRGNDEPSERAEHEAKWFAYSFLMPEQRFKVEWEKCFRVPELVSKYFLVPPVAAKNRAESLGLAI